MTRGQQPVSDQYFDQEIIVSDANLDQLITSFYELMKYNNLYKEHLYPQLTSIIAVSLNYSNIHKLHNISFLFWIQFF